MTRESQRPDDVTTRKPLPPGAATESGTMQITTCRKQRRSTVELLPLPG